MQSYLIIILIISLIGLFFFGIFVGTYKIFPYSEFDNIKAQFEFSDRQVDYNLLTNFSPHNLISIENKDNILQKRNELIKFIWKTDHLPDILPDIIEKQINDERFEKIKNLKQIDKLTIQMRDGVDSIIYLFLPEVSNNKLTIYHQGHSGGFINGKVTIEQFLNQGYTVAAFSMPLTGMNSQPMIDIENIGPIKFSQHKQFVLLERNSFSTISYFLTPLSATLNHLDENYQFDEYHMIGISGGGWASTIYPAIDPRISKSFSVSGSLPLGLRHDNKDIGDYEQFHPGLYSIVNYLELYVMSSYGYEREFVQIINKYDPCCFAGNSYEYYNDEVEEIVNRLNSGNFSIIVDDTHYEHKISTHAFDLILERLS